MPFDFKFGKPEKKEEDAEPKVELTETQQVQLQIENKASEVLNSFFIFKSI